MLKDFRVYFFMIITLTTAAQMNRRRNIKFIVKELKCTSFSPKVSKFECFSTYEKKRSAINVNVMLKDDLQKVQAHVRCTIFRLNQRSYHLIDGQVNVCQLLSLGARGSLMQIFMKELKHSDVNLIKGCPFKKNVSYGVANFYPDSTFFRLFTPDFNYTNTIDFYSDTEKYAVFKSFGAVCLNNKFCETYFDKDKEKLER